MCDPVSLAAASTAVASAGSFMKFQGQNRAWDDNRHAAGMTYASTFNALERKRVQTQAQSSEDNLSALIEGITARGRISAGAADLGIDAQSTAQQSNAADFAAGRDQAINDQNTANALLGIKQDLGDADLRRQNQIRQVSKASPLGLVLDLAGNGLKGANQAMSLGARA